MQHACWGTASAAENKELCHMSCRLNSCHRHFWKIGTFIDSYDQIWLSHSMLKQSLFLSFSNALHLFSFFWFLFLFFVFLRHLSYLPQIHVSNLFNFHADLISQSTACVLSYRLFMEHCIGQDWGDISAESHPTHLYTLLMIQTSLSTVHEPCLHSLLKSRP